MEGGVERKHRGWAAPGHDPCGFLFRGQGWDRRALGHVVLFQSPCVAPERARMQRLYSRHQGVCFTQT